MNISRKDREKGEGNREKKKKRWPAFKEIDEHVHMGGKEINKSWASTSRERELGRERKRKRGTRGQRALLPSPTAERKKKGLKTSKSRHGLARKN